MSFGLTLAGPVLITMLIPVALFVIQWMLDWQARYVAQITNYPVSTVEKVMGRHVQFRPVSGNIDGNYPQSYWLSIPKNHIDREKVLKIGNTVRARYCHGRGSGHIPSAINVTRFEKCTPDGRVDF